MVLRIKSQEFAFFAMDSASEDTTKISAPFYLAISALFGLDETATTV